uniref:CD44 antigen n=1 Tax=Chelydra serpentina TaxID=8475 RepID=A0A8C3XID1_CHESE
MIFFFLHVRKSSRHFTETLCYCSWTSMWCLKFNISCRYAGVFHVEKNRRYNLTRNEAVELCRALNSTLPTMDQMKKAHKLGFETCRYGYIEDKIVIPRIKPYYLCAANSTGIYILTSNITDRYDTYCYNASGRYLLYCGNATSMDPEDTELLNVISAPHILLLKCF